MLVRSRSALPIGLVGAAFLAALAAILAEGAVEGALLGLAFVLLVAGYLIRWHARRVSRPPPSDRPDADPNRSDGQGEPGRREV